PSEPTRPRSQPLFKKKDASGDIVPRWDALSDARAESKPLGVSGQRGANAFQGQGAGQQGQSIPGLKAESADKSKRLRMGEEGTGKDLAPKPVDEPAPAAEEFAGIVENPFVRVDQAPLSTFSIDVDPA